MIVPVSEIAAITGTDGRTIPLGDAGTAVVFRRTGDSWQNDRTLEFSPGEDCSLAGLRRNMAELVAFLKDCRTVVVQSAGGALFYELEKARCSVWEIAGSPQEFLDCVWREENAEHEQSPDMQVFGPAVLPPAPREVAPGRFVISITEIQKKRPEMSSKQVLRDFIRRGAFTEIEIECDHVPPWIEAEAVCRGLSLDITDAGETDGIRLVVRKRNGEGCIC